MIEDLKAEGAEVAHDGTDKYVFFTVPTQLLTINGEPNGETVFGIEAVLGTTSAFSYQDKTSGFNANGDPAISSA